MVNDCFKNLDRCMFVIGALNRQLTETLNSDSGLAHQTVVLQKLREVMRCKGLFCKNFVKTENFEDAEVVYANTSKIWLMKGK